MEHSSEQWHVTPLSCVEYAHLQSEGQSLLQSAVWGELKSSFGWHSHYFSLAHAAYGSFPLLLLTRRFRGGLLFGYGAHAPSISADSLPPEEQLALLSGMSRALIEHLARAPFVIRWDPLFYGDPPFSAAPPRRAKEMRLKAAPHSVQPRHTILIDLSPTKEEILAQMKAKTRYNIRLAEKHGVHVRRMADHHLGQWYRIYRETCLRNRIGARSYAYFQRLLRIARERAGEITIALLHASYEEKLLGGIIVVLYNSTATYLFGASSHALRNLMPNHLLQWHAMQWAKEEGCRYYDLFGVAPAATGHYLSGLYRFKSGFGGRLITRWGSIDYAASALLTRCYHMGERGYFLYHRRLKRR